MKNRKKTDGIRGFTLLETMISIAMLSIVVLAIYSLSLTGMRFYAMNNQTVQGQTSTRLVLLKLTQDIRSLPSSDSYDQIVFTVDGTANTKTLQIGADISYVFDASAGTIERTVQTGASTITTMSVEGIDDFTAIKDDVSKNEISVRIQGTGVKEIVESNITFRDVV